MTEQLLHSLLPNPEVSDDLNSFLCWLQPKEHQSRPPSLRLKNSIRAVIKNADMTFVDALKIYYFDLVRTEYMSAIKLNAKISHRDLVRLEKRLGYPCDFVSLLDDGFVDVISSLNHYIIDTNESFRHRLKSKIRELILDDDFDLAVDIINWIDKSGAHALHSKDLILDIIIEKIGVICKTNMEGKWNKRFLVVETFNKFTSEYWSHFAHLLSCPEDDHNLTKVVYNCFESEFIRIRTEEIYDIIMDNGKDSKNTLLELKKILRKPKDFEKLVSKLLMQFERKIMNPSVSTVDALLAYIKSMKCFMTIDFSGRYIKIISQFVRSFFRERKELVKIILYSILDFNGNDFQELQLQQIPNLEYLSHEIRDDLEYNSKNKMRSQYESTSRSFSAVYNGNSIDSSFILDKNSSNKSLIYENILKQFLIWTPELNDTVETDDQDVVPIANASFSLFDILLEIFENKNDILSEFLSLLSKKLLYLKSYELETNWADCLQLLKNKYSKPYATIISGDSNNEKKTNENPVDEEYQLNMNKINVILSDIKQSSTFFNEIRDIDPFADARIVPKFISPMYWEMEGSELIEQNIHNHLIYSSELLEKILRYGTAYCGINPGRMLTLYKDKGLVELELEFNDGRTQTFTVTMYQFTVIEKFNDITELTLEQICTSSKMDIDNAVNALQYWVDHQVLGYNGTTYYSLETIT